MTYEQALRVYALAGRLLQRRRPPVPCTRLRQIHLFACLNYVLALQLKRAAPSLDCILTTADEQQTTFSQRRQVCHFTCSESTTAACRPMNTPRMLSRCVPRAYQLLKFRMPSHLPAVRVGRMVLVSASRLWVSQLRAPPSALSASVRCDLRHNQNCILHKSALLPNRSTTACRCGKPGTQANIMYLLASLTALLGALYLAFWPTDSIVQVGG